VAINPSCNLKDGLIGFPNLGDPPFKSTRKEMALNELTNAGFPRGSWILREREIKVYTKDSEAAQLAGTGIYIPEIAKRSATEWITVYDVEANLYGWKFSRNWYYWVAEVQYENDEYGIPIDLAEEFHKQFGKEVRVAGHCGCPSPREWYKGKPCECYHVDTIRGFEALVKLLKQHYGNVEAQHEKVRQSM
jgi:hypothetical protein